jgi:hypothetical protein
MKAQIEWLDGYREPQAKPDPAFPDGKDLDVSEGRSPSCSTPLPYPAKRCGLYMVKCLDCGFTVAVTTAGRPDDPRSLKMACKRKLQ